MASSFKEYRLIPQSLYTKLMNQRRAAAVNRDTSQLVQGNLWQDMHRQAPVIEAEDEDEDGPSKNLLEELLQLLRKCLLLN